MTARSAKHVDGCKIASMLERTKQPRRKQTAARATFRPKGPVSEMPTVLTLLQLLQAVALATLLWRGVCCMWIHNRLSIRRPHQCPRLLLDSARPSSPSLVQAWGERGV